MLHISSTMTCRILSITQNIHFTRVYTLSREQWSSGILWPERTRFALDRQNISGSDLDQFEKTCGPQLPSYRDLRIRGLSPLLCIPKRAATPRRATLKDTQNLEPQNHKAVWEAVIHLRQIFTLDQAKI